MNIFEWKISIYFGIQLLNVCHIENKNKLHNHWPSNFQYPGYDISYDNIYNVTDNCHV